MNKEQISFLTFYIKGEQFGVAIDTIKEIADCYYYTRVPMMPKEFLGITNIRGRIISVVDGARRLKLGEFVLSKNISLIITNVTYDNQEVMMAMAVESIGEVVEIKENMVQDTPSFGMQKAPFVTKYVEFNGEFVPLIDIRKLLFFDNL